jgi:NTE family protein
LSPYQFNPLNFNPLREALLESIDFERLRNGSPIKLLLAATRVTDGRLRILTNRELTVEVVLASACLPLLHQSIVIDGEAYWDGGYAANPPLIPLVRASKSDHVLIVQVTPMKTNKLPVTVPEISKRVDQIQFNATLNSELEALKLGKLIGANAKLRRLRIGRISADEEVEGLAQESAGNIGSEFLERLRASGHVAADLWLKKDIPQGASRQSQEQAL